MFWLHCSHAFFFFFWKYFFCSFSKEIISLTEQEEIMNGNFYCLITHISKSALCFTPILFNCDSSCMALLYIDHSYYFILKQYLVNFKFLICSRYSRYFFSRIRLSMNVFSDSLYMQLSLFFRL